MKFNDSANIVALIPARINSSRFPGKPMAKILNKPMIGHVYDQVIKSKLIDYVAIATCDNEIYDYINSIGGNAVMTGDYHERASDRCAEALSIIETNQNKKFDIVIMVQGDEPMIHPNMIEDALYPMINDKKVLITNLLGKIKSLEEFEDRNCIKVVCDLKGDALYFSREPIPSRAIIENVPWGKQVCVIPFQRDFLLKYNQMEHTPLEIAESIDMMRILENGYKVRMVPTDYNTYAVDTLKDLIKVEKLMRSKNI